MDAGKNDICKHESIDKCDEKGTQRTSVKYESRTDCIGRRNSGIIMQYCDIRIDSAVSRMCSDAVLCWISGMCNLQHRHLRGQALVNASVDRSV